MTHLKRSLSLDVKTFEILLRLRRNITSTQNLHRILRFGPVQLILALPSFTALRTAALCPARFTKLDTEPEMWTTSSSS